MEKYIDILSKVALFQDIRPGDLISMLSCLAASTVKLRREEYVFMAGDQIRHVGIVLEGSLQILSEDVNGNRTIIAPLSQGDFFAEALCCAGVEKSPVSVLADTDADVMLLEFHRILHVCPNSCAFHTKLVGNMLGVIATKNLALQSRMEILSKKSIRGRLLSYLQSASKSQGNEFTVPFNREDLADFLCVDRSALSREMGNLKDEGIIEYHRNKFKLFL